MFPHNMQMVHDDSNHEKQLQSAWAKREGEIAIPVEIHFILTKSKKCQIPKKLGP